MTTAIRFTNVSKKFTLHHQRARSVQEVFVNMFQRTKPPVDERDFWVLKDVSFSVEHGQSVGFIGVNGAGKSTILKLISQVLMPTIGQIEVNGKIGALLEVGTGFHPDMTGRENIYLNGSILGLSREQIDKRLKRIIDFAEIGQFIDIPVKHYSSGMYVRLGFSIIVHTDLDILLIDEVLSVGDAAFQRKCMDRIFEIKDKGATILYVSHDPGTVQKLCDRAIWFENGELYQDGPVYDVIMQYTRSTYEDHHPLSDPEEYLEEDLVQAETPEETEALQERRWGSGEVELEAVRFLNTAGQETSLFTTGDPLTIELTYYTPERIEKPVFGLALHTTEGIHVTGPNTRFAQVDLVTIQGRGTVRYTVPELPLLEGHYELSVAVTDWTTNHLFDYHDRLYEFRVQPNKSGENYGVVTLNGTWQAETLTQQAPLNGPPHPEQTLKMKTSP